MAMHRMIVGVRVVEIPNRFGPERGRMHSPSAENVKIQDGKKGFQVKLGYMPIIE